MLGNLKKDNSIKVQGDSLGGGFILETGVYDFAVDTAYLDQSKGGALSLNLVFKNADGKTYKETLWMTSGTEKGQLNYYLDKNSEKQYLPGFVTANDLCLLTLGKDIADLETEEKVLNIYNYDLKKDAPTKKQVVMDLLGQEVKLGIQKSTIDKTAKDASGKYVPTGETRDQNEIVKVFKAETGQTVTEIEAGADGEFITAWIDKNAGKTRNKAKGASANAGTPGAPAGNAPATKSLFNK